MPNDTLFSVSEVAVILRVHPNTVKRMIKRGELQAYRFGKRGDYRISQGQLDAYLEASET